LLKDNIGTGDKMQTSAGSLALVGAPAPADAVVVERLRNAGAVILGKTNLTEWAALRDLFGGLPDGWSQRGGQTRSALGRDMVVSGSSSGSAVAVSAGFVALAVGTETSGSILSPALANRVVGMRPTLGLLSQAGLVPVSKRQDTAGPMARSVLDAALLLNVMAGAAQVKLDAQALRGARLGYPVSDAQGVEGTALAGLAARLERAGATLVPVQLEYPQVFELTPLLLFDFKRELADYLALRPGIGVRNLTDVICFNSANPAEEGYRQSTLEEAEQLEIPEDVYQMATTRLREQCQQLIDAALLAHDLAAFVEFGASDLLIYAAAAGYPGLFVPSGLNDPSSPAGVNFTGSKGCDQQLLSLGYAFEQAR
jgi:amidase